jgi:hypothetical protein
MGKNNCINYFVLLRDSLNAAESLSLCNKGCNVGIMTLGCFRATSVTVKSN